MIHFSRMSFDQIPLRERYDAWRSTLGPAFAVEPLGEETHQGFDAVIETTLLDRMLLVDTVSTNQRFERTASHLGWTGVEHVMVELVRQGTHLLLGDRPMPVQCGDIIIFDLTQPYTITCLAESDGVRHLFRDWDCIVPRDLVRHHVANIEDLHNLVLPVGTLANTLLANHLRSLFQARKQIDEGLAPVLVNTTAELLGALLASHRRERVLQPKETATIRMAAIRQLIDQHLGDPSLNAEFLLRRLPFSRGTLYRLCGPLGGVQALIRHRRLRMAKGLLQRQGATLSVTRAALQVGFGGPDTFTRAFKKEFGILPSHLSLDSPAEASGDSARSYRQQADWGIDTRLFDWVIGLSEPQTG